jgi:phosphoglycolate phosphatase-like HAD superfamily hydrolase
VNGRRVLIFDLDGTLVQKEWNTHGEGAGKPSSDRQVPRVIQFRCGCKAAYVGDAVYDMRIASAAGITAIGRVTAGNGDALRHAGAHHLIDDLTQLAGIL